MKTGMEILRLAGRLSAKFIIWLAGKLEKSEIRKENVTCQQI